MHNHLERINNSLQAMDIEEADNTVLSSPVSFNPMVCQQNEVFSLEDLAWVDSCLNKDSDISESVWTPLRDALSDIIKDELVGTTFQGDPFLPTYNEDLKPTYEREHASENIFKAWNLNCANDEMEEAYENIFKVWDLDIPVEEGELVKQLKKALSVLDDSEKGKDLKEGSLDNLIAGKDLNEGPTHNKHMFNQTQSALHTIAE
ncbi:hypothetical protein RYX36_007626, partial [Vicia faba]